MQNVEERQLKTKPDRVDGLNISKSVNGLFYITLLLSTTLTYNYRNAAILHQ